MNSSSTDVPVDNELEEVLLTRGYILKKLIGNGGTAVCYLIYSKKYNDNFVCKKIHLNKGYVCKTCELEALKQLNSPFIIRIYDFIVKPEAVYLILEYCPGGTLQDYIDVNGPFDMDKQIPIAFQLLTSLQFIHEKHVAHLDLKPSNMFIDRYGRIKLADFGFSRAFPNVPITNQHAGTMHYMSPEIFVRGPFDPFKADIWAMGISLFLLSTGYLPWKTNATINSKSIDQQLLSCPENMNNNLYILCRKLLRENPRERMPCDVALNLQIFSDVDRKEAILKTPRTMIQPPGLIAIQKTRSLIGKSPVLMTRKTPINLKQTRMITHPLPTFPIS
ncbi:CAMK family protein kinase [Tritrichomonas foetus]|uniref:CAMK family protein kinase n=1 Tax=Tritrichomonas foetus TaxID=1144522 RepID=A0A1J4KC15_9EUKA|nr:CAMK family protein kinase [Tritrichomonas foetus]|eukprot:OHT08506.1 CAMK family protein kinase [Tritrichomonas foetus]